MRIGKSIALAGGLLVLASALASAQVPKARTPSVLRPAGSLVPRAPASLASFEDSQSVENWWPMGTARIQRTTTGGSPGGFLDVNGFIGRDAVGAFTTRPEFVGAYGHAGVIAFDVKLGVQQVADYKLRVLLQRDPGVIFWSFDVSVPADSAWHHVSIPFDPSWTDGQAATGGWHAQSQGPAMSWRDTLASVYRVGVMAERPGTVAGNYATRLGIDNLVVQR
jgi:hypothetical protein